MSRKSPAAGSQFNLTDIVGDLQGMYAKDKTQKAMFKEGDEIKEYTRDDGIPLDDDHPIKILLELPCFPYNKIIQFAGNPDTGKSTMSAAAIVAAQRAGWIVVVWDAEDKFDMQRLAKLGGDPAKILLIKTNEILQGGEKVRKSVWAIKKRYPDAKILVVWDSVGGSQSRAHAESELDGKKKPQPGVDARENSMVMKAFVGLFNKFPNSICIYLANQVYAKIGMFQLGDAQSGGKKVEFHSSVIVTTKRLKKLTVVGDDGVKRKIGVIVSMSVHKNHLSSSDASVDELFFKITARGIELTTNPFDKKAKVAKAASKGRKVATGNDEPEELEEDLDESDELGDQEE